MRLSLGLCKKYLITAARPLVSAIPDAVIDLGSHQIKTTIFENNHWCTRISSDICLARVLADKDYQYIPQPTIDAIINVIRNEKARTQLQSIIATAALRDFSMRNRQAYEIFVARIYEAVGINVQLLTPDEEGYYAYLAVQAILDIKHKPVFVLDIGGKSAQLSFKNTHGEIEVNSTPFAYWDLVAHFDKSGLPTTSSQIESAIDLVAANMRIATNATALLPVTPCYGIGGVFAKINSQLGVDLITTDALLIAANNNARQSPLQVYHFTLNTLLLGYMRKMSVSSMQTLPDVSLGMGVLNQHQSTHANLQAAKLVKSR